MITLKDCVEKQFKKDPCVRQALVDIARCPCCNEILVMQHNGRVMGEKRQHCPACGQRLDWGHYNG